MIRGWINSILTAGLCLYSCTMSGKSVGYEQHVVGRSSFPVYLYCQGQVAPLLSKQFKAEKKGNIHYAIPLDESVEYGEGTMVASIAPFGNELRVAKTELYSQQKELALLKKELLLQEQLYNKGQISKNELERNRISLTRKRLEVKQASNKKDVQYITAPFKGHLSFVSAPDGAEVSEGSDLFTWVDWNTLRVKMSIPDYHLKRITRGKPVMVEGFMLQHPITCEVATIISNPSDNSGGNGPAGAPGANSMASAYLPIDSANITAFTFPRGEVVCKYIDTGLVDVICVPVAYLSFKGNQAYLKKTGATLTPVQLGVVGDSLAEITSGIAENDTIVRRVSTDDEFSQ